MKTYISITVLILLLIGCGVSIKSVVDPNIETPYEYPMFVIIKESGTGFFSDKLEKQILKKFQEAGDRIKVKQVYLPKNNELKLNESSDIEKKIQDELNGNEDILIVCKATNLRYYNGALQSATFILVGQDLNSGKEVWKAEFNSSSTYGPAVFVAKVATKIHDQLKIDKVI